MTIRSKDTYQKQVYDFIRDIYVVCPSCGGQAMVRCSDFLSTNKDEHQIKLVCSKCGHNKRLEEKSKAIFSASANNVISGRYLVVGGAIDPYFHLPLWLTIHCCNNILWAYNYEHLDFLLKHVSAKLRERNTQVTANKSLGSRLPGWMTSKKNRDAVVNCINELKEK